MKSDPAGIRDSGFEMTVTVQVAALVAPGALVEIDVVAARSK
jgi:enamine deaminase RidA (YjgF/YER057c/UK114 family)